MSRNNAPAPTTAPRPTAAPRPTTQPANDSNPRPSGPEALNKQIIPPERKGTSQITQADLLANPVKMPDVIYRTIFSSATVKNLKASDFNISSKELITMNVESCMLILFYVENEESKQLATIWAVTAQQVAGPIFGAVNMLNENKVAEAFMKLKTENGNPMHPYSLRGYPFILVYRGGWPVAFYNGARTVAAITEYALTLACNINYSEPLSLAAGMQTEYQIEMPSYDIYSNDQGLRGNKVRTNSLEYQDRGIRGFNPNLGVAMTGSAEATKDTEARNREALEEIKETEQTNAAAAPPTVVRPT